MVRNAPGCVSKVAGQTHHQHVLAACDCGRRRQVEPIQSRRHHARETDFRGDVRRERGFPANVGGLRGSCLLVKLQDARTDLAWRHPRDVPLALLRDYTAKWALVEPTRTAPPFRLAARVNGRRVSSTSLDLSAGDRDRDRLHRCPRFGGGG